MADPRGPRFWSEELVRLRESLGELVISALLAGADGGVNELPQGLQAAVDWDRFNQEALSFVRDYDFNLIKDINDTTREQTVQAINDWLESGESLPKLRQKLTPIYEDGRRAQLIAQTETTRLFAEGNKMAWEASGTVGGQIWRTTQQDVCPICQALEGKIVGLEQDFAIPGGEITPDVSRQLRGRIAKFRAPPDPHPGCRCWLQPIVSEEKVRQRQREILNG